MLVQSSAFAEARRLSRIAIGSTRLDSRITFITAVQLYEAQIRNVSKRDWVVDIPITLAQTGRVSDVERTYSRYLRQFLAYWQLHTTKTDPGWTAVTGYYCAFFGAQTLLSLVGLGTRALPRMSTLPAGVYSVSEGPSQFADHILLGFRKQDAGSHRSLWTQLTGFLDVLVRVPANDSGAILTLQSFRQLVLGPPSLAKLRNEINYSIDYADTEVGAWPSEFSACGSVQALERRLQVTSPAHEPQRFELVALGAGSLARALYEDYVTRGSAIDFRPRAGRRAAIARAAREHPASVWF